MRTPEEWDLVHEPAYAYWAYYVWANLYVLNGLRAARGLGHIAFRPHAGEAGDVDHLVAAFLLAKNIAHGINLRKSPVMQHLFYLAQIGLNLSPLSNNRLFLDYHRNPFPIFFARGLPVALSTDDPLQIHLTKEPLVEEYSVAAQVWKFSHTDLCEIARTSVLNSGFSHADKCHWVGDTYWKEGAEGNEAAKTNVADVRLCFRHDTLLAERTLVMHGAERAERRFAAKGVRRFSVV
jgi:AMP deaminase